jgi:hypothetical protein
MRTVSFSASGVRKLLDEEFICLRLNTRGDPSAGESFSLAPDDPAGPCVRGNGQQNVQILFLTPSGEFFHVLTGFVGPEELQSELEFALATYDKLSREGEDRRAVVRDAHLSFLRQASFNDTEIERPAKDAAALFAGITEDLPAGADGRLSFDVFDRVVRRHVLADHRFAVDHPLLPMARFKPETLVGSGKSFFGSTSIGSAPRDFGGRRQR